METKQESIIRHSLGLNRKTAPYRNYYVTDADEPDMRRLVDAGLMRQGRTIPGGLVAFFVTEAGAASVGAVLPRDR